MILKGVSSSGTRVDIKELQQEKAIWTLKYKSYFVDRTVIKNLADRTAQKQQQTWKSDNTVRYGSHQEWKSTRLTWRCIDL